MKKSQIESIRAKYSHRDKRVMQSNNTESHKVKLCHRASNRVIQSDTVSCVGIEKRVYTVS